MEESLHKALEQEIHKMIQNKTIREVQSQTDQFVSKIFVKKEPTKYRPIINYKPVNAMIRYRKFKMETVANLKQLIKPKDLMIKIDMKEAFTSIPINSKQAKYLRFVFDQKIYQVQTLFFGMGPAPRLFTKLLKIPISLLRKLQIRLMIYIDDIIICALSHQEILMARDTTIYLLESLGLTINYKKSSLQPLHQMEYLGLVIDSKMMVITLPEQKIQATIKICEPMLSKPVTEVKLLSRVIGKLVSMGPAIVTGPLFIRSLQNSLKKALSKDPTYEGITHLSKKAREELTWWKKTLKLNQGKSLTIIPPEITISSDASLEGWGAACASQTAGGKWTQEEKEYLQHINVMEIKAALLALQTFYRIHHPKSVLLKIDNTTTIAYICNKGGSKNQKMNEIAKELWTFATQRKVQISVEYIPSKQNWEADRESRTTDTAEWKLCPQLFYKITQILGVPEIDLFASRATKQIQNYISYKPDPQAQAIDAFQTKWQYQLVYAFPPFKLLDQVMNKLVRDRTTGIIITPAWHTCPWYPLLLERAIANPILLPKQQDLLLDPAGNQHPMVQNNKLQLVAWKVSAENSKTAEYHKRLQSSCSSLGHQEQQRIMRPPGRYSLAGVSNGTLIPFDAL